MSKEIKVEEVAKHAKKSSPCWIIIHNNVYDVTKFLNEHPGGADALKDYAGKDASQAFEDVGHSDDARELLKKYKIGHLPAEQKNTFIDPCWSYWWFLALAVAILGGAFAARKKLSA